jgi:hypothetical protein
MAQKSGNLEEYIKKGRNMQQLEDCSQKETSKAGIQRFTRKTRPIQAEIHTVGLRNKQGSQNQKLEGYVDKRVHTSKNLTVS